VRVLSVIHEDSSAPGTYGEVAEGRGHEHAVWPIHADHAPPAGPFGAVMVFGGTMDTHEEDSYAWLRDENDFIRAQVEAGVPVLGVCLGGQLLAKALGAQVSRVPEPEVGWYELERLPGAEGDPVFGGLPERFPSLQWHNYQFALPAGAVPLARSAACLQGYRFGEVAWGVQFHPEVTRSIVQLWIDLSREAGAVLDFDTFERDSDLYADGWERLGRGLCERFLAVAEAR
jgi:GMP synthase-like glutamine amidotransferase